MNFFYEKPVGINKKSGKSLRAGKKGRCNRRTFEDKPLLLVNNCNIVQVSSSLCTLRHKAPFL